MPTFVAYCLDRDGASDLRLSKRDEHLAYVRRHLDKLKLGGPMLNAGGEMIGSLLILEAETLAEAQGFLAADPYAQSGLFQRVELRQLRILLDGSGR